jgi:hypothetical protein
MIVDAPLVRAGYGYPKGSPNTNSYRRNPPLQLSIQCSPQRTYKWSSSEPHGATRQQAIAETPAKWSTYQIPSVIVVFVVLFVRLSLQVSFPKATRGLAPISYRGALLSTLLHAISYRGALLSTLLHAISYRGALLSTLLHATVYVYIQFAECSGTDCT